MQNRVKLSHNKRGFYQEWLILLAIVGLAAGLRVWRLGVAPPGLYHDEAFNGLDALRVLAGERPLFFAANNGREPLFIYSVALSVWRFGRTAFALRLPAAIFGTLTVLPFYFLTKRWFDRHTATFAALIWAFTVWPVHLSRVGFRTVLLPFFLALAAYLLTMAADRSTKKIPAQVWFFVAGLVYGLSFYTYLAARLSLLGLLIFGVYLWLIHRPARLLAYSAWFALGVIVVVAPLVVTLVRMGELLSGRTGDVSILNAAINQGRLWAVLGENFGRTLAMFFWRGDTILRHNPAGRPVFDWLLTLPFLFGVGWSVRHWRRPPVAALLIWVITLLAGTFFAADAPHFLRAAGILPVLLIFPAIGLSHLWNWSKLPAAFTKATALSKVFVSILLIGSFTINVNDYFGAYNKQAETGYMFEAAASGLAHRVLADLDAGMAVLVDVQFFEQWQAIPFLLPSSPNLVTYRRDVLLSDGAVVPVERPTSIYVWPYELHEFIAQMIPIGAKIDVRLGELMRLDSQADAYSMYTNYKITPDWANHSAENVSMRSADFNNLLTLWASATTINPQQLAIELVWSTQSDTPASLIAFAQVINLDDGTVMGQLDAAPGSNGWQHGWWRPDIFVAEERIISLPVRFDANKHTVLVGVYDTSNNNERLPRLDEFDQIISDSLELAVESGEIR